MEKTALTMGLFFDKTIGYEYGLVQKAALAGYTKIVENNYSDEEVVFLHENSEVNMEELDLSGQETLINGLKEQGFKVISIVDWSAQ